MLSSSFAFLAFGSDSLVEMFSGLAVALHLRDDSSGSKDHGEKAERLAKFLLVALIPIVGVGAEFI